MRQYFCGWYFRCQSDTHTLAVIPSIHKTGDRDFCCIQLITDTQSFHSEFSVTDFRRIGDAVIIGDNRFTKEGITLSIAAPDLTVSGNLRFGPFAALRYDIMGPFQFVPFMQCRHSVYSMLHRVDGELVINGTPLSLRNGRGYTEGDRGRSFPKEYAWVQCFFPGGSLMLSVADIPMGPCHFTGIIGFVYLNGTEHRIATYLGAKVKKPENREIIVQQGRLCLKIKGDPDPGHPLLAPTGGAMDRRIHEHPSCSIHCYFEANGTVLLDLDVPNAAFEYEY